MRVRVARGTLITLAILAFAAVSVLASQGRRARASRELDFDPNHIVWRWQGPFSYERDFGSSGPGCDFHGREIVDATLICTGPDIGHMRCQAKGKAAHEYVESVADANGARRQRRDAGSFEGDLKVNFETQEIRGWHLFNLDVGANIPIEYRNQSSAAANTGSYLLNVSGSTDPELYSPETERIEWHRTDRFFEAGPAACHARGFNGTYKIAVRLLPTD